MVTENDVAKKGFIWEYSSREIRVPHGAEAWQQKTVLTVATGSWEIIILNCLIQPS